MVQHVVAQFRNIRIGPSRPPNKIARLSQKPSKVSCFRSARGFRSVLHATQSPRIVRCVLQRGTCLVYIFVLRTIAARLGRAKDQWEKNSSLKRHRNPCGLEWVSISRCYVSVALNDYTIVLWSRPANSCPMKDFLVYQLFNSKEANGKKCNAWNSGNIWASVSK